MLIFGTASAVFAQKNKKNQKTLGTLSVKSSPESYPVRVNGQVLGMSGVGTGAEFPLEEGTYNVEVEGAGGQIFRKSVTIRRAERNCICLTVVQNVVKRACPYNIVVDADKKVIEGDTVTFSSRNLVEGAAVPVNYKWSVSGGTITSGLGTSMITVDTRGMGGQTVSAFLDVTDDIPGSTCQQRNEVPVLVEKLPEPVHAYQCDVFESKSHDDNKARFDNCVLRLQDAPNSQIYVILYQGTDKRSVSVDKLSKQTLDYFVKTRGVDPRQIVITKWGNRPRTTIEVWIVPPGAQPPVPQQ
jgi:hypothetical protein